MTTTPVRTSRRALVHGAAWSVPVVTVAAAAPAFAASPCAKQVNQTLDWNGPRTTFTRNSNNLGATAIHDPDGAGNVPSISLTVAARYFGNMIPGYQDGWTPNPNLRVANAVGGLNVSGLAFHQATTSATPQGRGDRGTYTFTFSRPVTNLQFTLTDIDSAYEDFLDVAEPSAGYVVVSQGSGIATDTGGPGGTRRFYRSVIHGPVDNTHGSAGNITLRYAGPISTFTITYWNAAGQFVDGIDSDQVIYISDLTFDYAPC